MLNLAEPSETGLPWDDLVCTEAWVSQRLLHVIRWYGARSVELVVVCCDSRAGQCFSLRVDQIGRELRKGKIEFERKSGDRCNGGSRMQQRLRGMSRRSFEAQMSSRQAERATA